MANIYIKGQVDSQQVTPEIRQIWAKMKNDIENGISNGTVLVDPTGEYLRQFEIKIGKERWRQAILHFFGK